jgi:CubicO group peptidase (beta-lactamase class C family)
MKFQKLLLFSFVAVLLSSCYALRAYKFRKLKLNDHERMPFEKIIGAAQSTSFPKVTNSLQKEELTKKLDSTLKNTYTAAFVIMRNDSVLYEEYFDGFNASSLLPSFSVAKSVVSTLVGIAHSEGKIKSTQEPITNYVPELLQTDERYAKISLQHLLDMRSGLLFNEGSYGLKDDAIKLGFTPNMLNRAFDYAIEKEPGGEFNYQSINTLLLALVVQRTTGKTLAQYAQEKLWQPLGATNATWTTDKKGQAIAFAGLNANAMDYARFGLLFLHKGFFNNQQIVPQKWVQQSTGVDSMRFYNGYHNQWWGIVEYKYFNDSLPAAKYKAEHENAGKVTSYKTKEGTLKWYVPFTSSSYHAEGILGQFVYVVPEKNIVVVRLGHNWQHKQFSYANGFIETLLKEL